MLTGIVNLDVSAMPHNKVGGKGKAIDAYMKDVAASTGFTELQASTQYDIYNECSKLWGPMAEEYERMAETLHDPTSPEYKAREKLQLIKTSESRTDEYHDVVSFASVDELVEWKTFRFSKSQLNEMDLHVEEGRK